MALNREDAVTLPDATLREQLRARHPGAHARIVARQVFTRDVLGVVVKDSVLPLSSIPTCLPPFWLASGKLLSLA